MIASMRVLRRATTRGERWALVAVAVALFGLMSMHGWGSHSAQPVPVADDRVAHPHASDHGFVADPPGEVVTPRITPEHGTTHGTVASDSGARTAAKDAAGSSASSPGNGHGDHGGLVELCLAILVGLVLTALLWVRHRGVHALSSWLPSWPLPSLAGRDRDPPDLLRLCVVRC